MELATLQALLVILDLLETLGKGQFTAEERKQIRDARRIVMKAMREQK